MPSSLNVQDDFLADDIDVLYNDPAIRDEIIRRYFREIGSTRRAKPQPDQPPPVKTDKHTFCPMMPPSVIVSRKINDACKTLYAWMLMQAHGNAICHASQKNMATSLGWSVKKVQRCLDMLEPAGFVETMMDVDGDTRNQDAYRLLVLAPKKTEPAQSFVESGVDN